MSCAHGLRSRDSTCEISTPFVSRIGAGCAIPLALAKKAVTAKQVGIERTSRCLDSTCSPMRGFERRWSLGAESNSTELNVADPVSLSAGEAVACPLAVEVRRRAAQERRLDAFERIDAHHRV